MLCNKKRKKKNSQMTTYISTVGPQTVTVREPLAYMLVCLCVSHLCLDSVPFRLYLYVNIINVHLHTPWKAFLYKKGKR